MFDVLSSYGSLLRHDAHFAHAAWVLNLIDVITSKGKLVIMLGDRYKWFANGVFVKMLYIYINMVQSMDQE